MLLLPACASRRSGTRREIRTVQRPRANQIGRETSERQARQLQAHVRQTSRAIIAQSCGRRSRRRKTVERQKGPSFTGSVD